MNTISVTKKTRGFLQLLMHFIRTRDGLDGLIILVSRQKYFYPTYEELKKGCSKIKY